MSGSRHFREKFRQLQYKALRKLSKHLDHTSQRLINMSSEKWYEQSHERPIFRTGSSLHSNEPSNDSWIPDGEDELRAGGYFVHVDFQARHSFPSIPMLSEVSGSPPLPANASQRWSSSSNRARYINPLCLHPTSFRRRMEALEMSDEVPLCEHDSNAHLTPFESGPEFHSDADEDFLGDAVRPSKAASATLFTQQRGSYAPKTSTRALSHKLSKIQPSARTHGEYTPSMSSPLRQIETVYDPMNVKSNHETIHHDQPFSYPPVADNYSYREHLVKHGIFKHEGNDTVPSLTLSTPNLTWSGCPVVMGRIPGAPLNSSNSSRYLHLMVDSGAEKCVIKKTSLPPNTQVYSVPYAPIGGLGGQHGVTEQAVIKLIFAAHDAETEQPLQVAVQAVADVLDQVNVPAMRNLDMIFGWPAVVAYCGSIVSGIHSPGSAHLVLHAAESEIHDPSSYGDSVFRERAAREAFEQSDPFHNLAGIKWKQTGWQPNRLKYRHAMDTKRRVAIPIAHAVNYWGDHSTPLAVEDWSEGRGRISLRSTLDSERDVEYHGFV